MTSIFLTIVTWIRGGNSGNEAILREEMGIHEERLICM